MDSDGAASLCTPGRSPSPGVKVQGSWWQYSKPALHRSVGGACVHKTDGKPFCVAAPIPGAGAGGGRRGGERVEFHEMGGSTGRTKRSPTTAAWETKIKT